MFQVKKQPGVKVGVGVAEGTGVAVGDGVGSGVGHGPRYATTIASSASTVPSQAQISVTWKAPKLSLIASPVQSIYWKNDVDALSFSSKYSEHSQPGVGDGVGVVVGLGVTSTQGPKSTTSKSVPVGTVHEQN
jgi:hypothetical protein